MCKNFKPTLSCMREITSSGLVLRCCRTKYKNKKMEAYQRSGDKGKMQEVVIHVAKQQHVIYQCRRTCTRVRCCAVAKQQHVIDQWCKTVGVPEHEDAIDDVSTLGDIGGARDDDDADTGVFDDDDADVVQVRAAVYCVIWSNLE